MKPDATLESMVIINRANTEEAEAVLKIIHEFSDVFKVEVQSEPALVANELERRQGQGLRA